MYEARLQPCVSSLHRHASQVAQPLRQRTAAVHALQARLQGGWRADGHRFLGRRAVRLFRRQPVLGTLVAWLPPAPPVVPKQPAADADADAADAAVPDADADDDNGADAEAPPRAPPSPPALRRCSSRTVAPPSEFWRAAGGPSDAPRRRSSSPPRATRRGPMVVGEDAVLFRLLHDDGDEEDLEEEEAVEALGLYATGRYGSDRCVILSLAAATAAAAAAAATPTAHAAAAVGTGASPSAATAYLAPRATRHSHLALRPAPRLKKAKARPLAPMAGATEAAEAAEVAAEEEDEWQVEGHPLLRQEVARTFGRGAAAQVAFGLITRWLPADAATGDGALLHCLSTPLLSPYCSLTAPLLHPYCTLTTPLLPPYSPS